MGPFLIVLVVGVAVGGWLGSSGLPTPQGDDAVYKSPAAELVQNGRLAIPCMTGFLPRSETVFVHYPPLYQLMLSLWYLVVGFSLRCTLAFSYTVHLLNALAIMLVTRRLLEPHTNLRLWVFQAILTAVGLIHVANLAYFDRPEEAALLWIWLEVLMIHRSAARQRILPYLASGVLVGLAGLTAPWVGVLGALVVTIRGVVTAALEVEPRRLAVWTRTSFRLGSAAAIAAVMGGAWYVAMEAMSPGIMQDQFFGHMRFLRETQGGGTVSEKIYAFANTVLFNPPQLSASVLLLVFFPAVVAGRGWRQVEPLALALYITGLLGLVAVAAARPAAYTYVGATLILLLPCFGPGIARFLGRSGPSGRLGFGLGLAVLTCCTTIAYKDVARLGVLTWKLPHEERPDQVFQRLTTVISPGELVAVTPRHWYAFQGRNPWREAYLSSRADPQEVLRCRWLVLYPGVGTPHFINAFERVEEIPSEAQTDGTYAYSVWRRKEL
jgi:hypothetical protein